MRDFFEYPKNYLPRSKHNKCHRSAKHLKILQRMNCGQLKRISFDSWFWILLPSTNKSTLRDAPHYWQCIWGKKGKNRGNQHLLCQTNFLEGSFNNPHCTFSDWTLLWLRFQRHTYLPSYQNATFEWALYVMLLASNESKKKHTKRW